MWSLRADGSGAQWTLSSSLPRDFAFENEAAKFYHPHSVEQLPTGDVLLLDDGNDRPGCKNGGTEGLVDDEAYKGCFSRAVMRPSGPCSASRNR